MTRDTGSKRAIGGTISTLAFAGCGLWLLAEAAVSSPLKAAMLTLCAASCLAAAVRSPIARTYAAWAQRSQDRNDTRATRDPS